MKIGVDYYPEQWDSKMWSRDAELMAKSGIKTVRLGSRAWTWLEPAEGAFDVSWLDQVISAFSAYHMEVVLCVPTNCPPFWMMEKYPDIMRTDTNGRKPVSGSIGNHCINSPTYRHHALQLAELLSRRYGAHPSVTAWQVDHDPEAYQCCCGACVNKFRMWLLDKYESMEGISNALGRNLYGGRYTDISQLRPPALLPEELRDPSLELEYRRFVSESVVEFIRDITMTIKKNAPKAKVTTDTSLSKNSPDVYKLYAMLDFASFDNTPPTSLYEDGEAVGSNAFYLDMMRGIKGNNFWIMEQLSGAGVKKGHMQPAPKPGMIKGYAFQALAHGADNIIHYRWRTPLSGTDMFRHGLIGHSNQPTQRFIEFTDLCREAQKLNVIDTTELVSDIAIVYSPECERALRTQLQSKGFSYMAQLRSFHKAFSGYGANVDIVPPTADLTRYKVVAAPSLYIYEKKASENLYRYVVGGGTLIMTNRSGVKDQNNNCIMDILPTVYKELIGAEIREYDPIGSGERSVKDYAGNIYPCYQWCDYLTLTTAKAYAVYNDDFYNGSPAVTMNRYCSGVAYYVGTVCDEEFYSAFAGNVMMQTGIPKLKGLPEGIEVTTRTNGLDEYIFFFNNSGRKVSMPLPKEMFSLFDSKNKETLELEPFGMDIVRK